ncbi:Rpp14 family [Emericellopsis cladophorae]|uniref:Rpp14 family n=1 Tax=Emericellopsis cladophorae TaxID=2686198 RepID=A0A9P9Y1I7_9HYPO|nr:Rpp14 family [Emericellopsis cladophorae]KAI6781395.1 Rpp14 family [Emericellopsis cladophorae]
MTPGSLLRGIKKEVEILYGDYGAGMLNGLQIKYLSLATSTFIIKCSRAMCSMLWSALTFMGRVPNKDGTGKHCIFRVVRVSGTIRKVEEEAIRQSRALIVAAKQEASEAQGSISGITRHTAGTQSSAQSHLAMVDDSDESMDDADG